MDYFETMLKQTIEIMDELSKDRVKVRTEMESARGGDFGRASMQKAYLNAMLCNLNHVKKALEHCMDGKMYNPRGE